MDSLNLSRASNRLSIETDLSFRTGYIVNKNISDLDTWATVFYVAALVNTIGLVIFLIYGSAEPLFFKENGRKNQAFDLDLMSGEREDSLLLAKKQNLFSTKFNGINPTFKGDDD